LSGQKQKKEYGKYENPKKEVLGIEGEEEEGE